MFGKIFTSLRTRLLLLVLLAIIPALGLILYTNFALRRMVVDDVRDGALRLTRLVGSDQADSIRDTRQLLFALAQLPQVRGDDAAACSEFLAQLLRQYPQYIILGVIGADGQLFCSAYSSPEPVDVGDQPYFQQAVENRDFSISDYQIDPISGKAILNFGYPVVDETGQAPRVVFASLDLTWLNQLANEAQLPKGSTFTVIDRNGTILVRYPNPQQWVGQLVGESPLVELILTRQDEGTVEMVGLDGESRLYAYAPLSGVLGSRDVYVSIGIPTDIAFAEADRVLMGSLAGLGAVTILALAAAWFIGHWFVLSWVQVLVDATRQLSAGNLEVRTGLPYGKGELSQLALAFDDMAEALERRVVERDQAQESLQETQRTLSTLLSNLPGMAYRCCNDRERTMLFASEGCLELTGYSPAALVLNATASYGSLIHVDERKLVWNKIQQALKIKGPFRLTYRLTTVMGQEKWIWEQGQGVFSPNGTLLALEGFMTDATERVVAFQQLEQRVADRTQDLLALYDVTAVASESLDLETILNRSLNRILTVMRAEMGAIYLVDQVDKELLVPVARQQKVSANAADIEVESLENVLVRWVFEKSQSLVLPSTKRGMPEVVRNFSQPGMAVPMRARGRVLGVLSIVRATSQAFNQEEVSLLDSIADQVAVAVENGMLYQQAEKLAVMEERSRLARELHDSVTQSLYSLTLYAEVGRRAAEAGDLEQVVGFIGQLGQVSQQTLKEMRLLVYELRTAALETEGLVGALQQRLDAVEKRAGVEVQLLVESMAELPAVIEEGLYRIAQEALNNTLKHADASMVTVRINVDSEWAELEVQDNGCAFDVQNARKSGGLGLISMRERTERLDGKLVIQSIKGQGTSVRVNIPTKRSWSRPILPIDNFSEVKDD